MGEKGSRRMNMFTNTNWWKGTGCFAAMDEHHPGLALFARKLHFQCLSLRKNCLDAFRTMPHTDAIIPVKDCPLCVGKRLTDGSCEDAGHVSRTPDEHHFLCLCPSISEERKEAVQYLAQWLGAQGEEIGGLLFPLERAHMCGGALPGKLSEIAKRAETSMLEMMTTVTEARKWLYDCYQKQMAKAKETFAQREKAWRKTNHLEGIGTPEGDTHLEEEETESEPEEIEMFVESDSQSEDGESISSGGMAGSGSRSAEEDGESVHPWGGGVDTPYALDPGGGEQGATPTRGGAPEFGTSEGAPAGEGAGGSYPTIRHTHDRDRFPP